MEQMISSGAVVGDEVAQRPSGPVQRFKDWKPSSLVIIPFATPFNFQIYHTGICGDVRQDQNDRFSIFLPDLLAGPKQFWLGAELGERPVIHPQPMAYLEKDIEENLNDDQGVDSFIFSGCFHHLS